MNTYIVTYTYNYGNPKTTTVKADSKLDAAHKVENRRVGNYVTDVCLV